MSEYIDRAALKQELAPYEENNFSQQVDVILAIVDAQPAADVAPVRHGRWSSNGIAIVCSECGKAYGIVEIFAHYCPWCGSRMDKEDEHEAG